MVRQVDLWIRKGMVIDPARNLQEEADVFVQGNRIVDVPPGETVTAKKIIDAAGLLVFPGLIDNHAHVFWGGTAIGIHPDSSCLPQGVTTVVDQGSAGINNFDEFARSIMQFSQVRIFAYLHAAPAGLATLPYSMEAVNPKIFDGEAIDRLFRKYPHKLVGLKIRQSREVVGDLGLSPLTAMLDIANRLEEKPRIVVHTTNSPESAEKIADLLRPNDIFAHVYQGKGSTILDARGKVLPAVRAAKKRGVLFDTADGRGHYAFSVAKAALQDGFTPDILSTDLVKASAYDRSVFGLPLILTKYLNMGMPLYDIVKACTVTPAKTLNMEGEIGSLAPGAYADIALFKLKETKFALTDVFDKTLPCQKLLLPQLTVSDGQIVYANFATVEK
ncbi:MAG: amidohydrolase family protein [Veillonellales bacterium]